MATHSSILAWRIPQTEEPASLQSMGSQEWDTTERLNNRQLCRPETTYFTKTKRHNISRNFRPTNGHGGGGLVAKLCPALGTSWTVAQKAPLTLGFSKQKYWSGLPFPSPRDLPNPGIKPLSPKLQGVLFTAEPPGKLQFARLGWYYSRFHKEKGRDVFHFLHLVLKPTHNTVRTWIPSLPPPILGLFLLL